MEEINASEFKAKCLAILDKIAQSGEGITVLKRGKPVVQVLPVVPRQHGYPQEALLGSVTILGDIIEPVLPEYAWEVEGSGK